MDGRIEIDNKLWHAWKVSEDLEDSALFDERHSLALRATLASGAWDDLYALGECQDRFDVGRKQGVKKRK